MAPENYTPFLRWPGGKRWAARKIVRVIREALGESGTYYEPFLGGGAVFFSLVPERAVLTDVNAELVNTYRVVRDNHESIISRMRGLRVSKDAYGKTRESRPRTPLSRAIRFLYLNRTAFAGIYRLNQDGEFNVPYGGRQRTPAVLWERELLLRAASVLKSGVTLRVTDFEKSMNKAGKGDVVYCDPTYSVAHDNNGFLRYNERIFSWSDQERLARAAKAAAKRGATVVVSNAHHHSLRTLYVGARTLTLHRPSCVSATSAGRRRVAEYLFILPGSKRVQKVT